MLVALYAAYFTARIKTANEHVLLSRAALQVPFSSAVGEAVVCAYGRLWNVQCADDAGTAALKNLPNLPEQDLPALNVSIRYLCAADPARRSMECTDRNMVGIAAILTVLSGVLAAAAIAFDARRLADRRSSMPGLVRYGIGAAASVLTLWRLSRVTLTTIWIGTLDERIIATRPILAFTGNVIGYGVLIALAMIGIVGVGASAATLRRR
ncbi:MAG TPA: hypothetical protein VGQ35_21525 [Dongiaceae bacterium]|nr:hypothetical protein [Dongiaceae bacterium]